MNHKKKDFHLEIRQSIQVNLVMRLLLWQPFKNVKIQMSYEKSGVEVMGFFKEKTERGKGGNENIFLISPVPKIVLKMHYIKSAKGNLWVREDNGYDQKRQGPKNDESEDLFFFF